MDAGKLESDFLNGFRFRFGSEELMQPILFIESNPDYLASLKSLLRNHGVTNPSYAVVDASQAVLYLKGEAPFSDRSRYPLPSIIFLDIHLEGYIGFKLLQWIKRQRTLASCFVVICSELSSIADLRKCYQYGAQTFLLKPYNHNELQNLLRHFPYLWTIGHAANEDALGPFAEPDPEPGDAPCSTIEVLHHAGEL